MVLFITLRADNEQYVCAENGGGREVVANRSAVGPWETFRVNDLNGGQLQSNEIINLLASNGQYICAESGGGNIVVANRNGAGPWEAFSIREVAGGSINSGSKVCLAAQNGQYVCAENGGGREVVANRSAVGPWETFTLEILSPPSEEVKVDSLKSKLEQLIAANLAQGNRGSAEIEKFDVDDKSANYKINIRHYHVYDAPLGIGEVTMYDVTTSVEGTLNPYDPTALASTEICVDLPSIVAAAVGQGRVCISLAELAALAL